MSRRAAAPIGLREALSVDDRDYSGRPWRLGPAECLVRACIDPGNRACRLGRSCRWRGASPGMVESLGIAARGTFRRDLDFEPMACEFSGRFSWMVGAQHSNLGIARRLLLEPRGFLLLRCRRAVARTVW